MTARPGRPNPRQPVLPPQRPDLDGTYRPHDQHGHEGHRHGHDGHRHEGHEQDAHQCDGHRHDSHRPHEHEAGTDHDRHDHGLPARVTHLLRPHSHDPADSSDAALESSAEGLRAVSRSLVILLATSAIQAAVVLTSGSVALLADTAHNLADALTAVPLGLAFLLGRRAPTRRFTYGLGRVEDLAGAVVVLMIAGSALVAAGESLQRLRHPAPVAHLVAVAVAGMVGFLGNELVAGYRIRVGRRIGSAALVADGYHARADGLTSLGVVVGAAGVALGWQPADPVVGLVITAAILLTLVGAVRGVGTRLLDGVDPALSGRAAAALDAIPGVAGTRLRLRWIGHTLRAEVVLHVTDRPDLQAAETFADLVREILRRELPRMEEAVVEVRRDRAQPAA
ncbi:MAG TPA: cation diffusion facilitator family transporter [Kineosporiaceae bacterium]|nr:cation diffusion facilitator family transporter [Kineosporiaceae bacterium]